LLSWSYFNSFILILLQVMPKRAALLFDRLLVALQKIVDNQEKDLIESKSTSKSLVHRFQAANSERVPGANDQTVVNSVLTFKQFYSKRSQYFKSYCKAIKYFVCNYILILIFYYIFLVASRNIFNIFIITYCNTYFCIKIKKLFLQYNKKIQLCRTQYICSRARKLTNSARNYYINGVFLYSN